MGNNGNCADGKTDKGQSKILIVGYGSMGKRRLRILKKIADDFDLICVDSNKARLAQIEEAGNKGYSNLADAIRENPLMAFVCTSPASHAEITMELINAGIHVFTELNLISNRYEEMIKSAESNKVKVFMSNTMLYDKQITSIISQVRKVPEKHTYIYHVGQYLPDWHPWESYKAFFAGKAQTNGCREILAIQLPWLISLFGNVEKVSVLKRKNTNLDIDFFDTYIISIEHKGGDTGVFVCDVLARKAICYLEIMGETTHVIWNGTPETLYAFDANTKQMQKLNSYDETEHIDGYSDVINEDQYFDETQCFLDWIKGIGEPLYTLKDDQGVLDLIDMIEGC